MPWILGASLANGQVEEKELRRASEPEIPEALACSLASEFGTVYQHSTLQL